MSYEVVQLIASNEPWTGNQMSYEVVQLIASNEPWTGNQMSYEVVQLIDSNNLELAIKCCMRWCN